MAKNILEAVAFLNHLKPIHWDMYIHQLTAHLGAKDQPTKLISIDQQQRCDDPTHPWRFRLYTDTIRALQEVPNAKSFATSNFKGTGALQLLNDDLLRSPCQVIE